ncbi:unnamed protein product [Schistosoma turkestanicum]|nr:unnamed protein product [Schistosoma turkestanicum]
MASSDDNDYILPDQVVCIEMKSVEPILCKPRLLPLKSVKLSGCEVENEIVSVNNIEFQHNKAT